MANGTVKWYNTTKGYGFIEPEDGGRDIFLHASALEKAGMAAPQEGQKISFELEQDRSGRSSAIDVRAI
jgi:CspA family cold shock protein